MKKYALVIIAICLAAVPCFAADFTPTLLKLSADPVIQYDFDGTSLSIPVQVSGTPAGLIFLVYTRGKAANIPATTNGHLGWHYVNKVDTCIYFSSLKSVNRGANTVTWDGKDQDGGVVSAGEYTYYIWAFDNQGTKTLAMTHAYPVDCEMFQERDGDGMPLAQPIFFQSTTRWKIGNDPNDQTLLETCSFTLDSGWAICMETCFDPKDFNYYYMQVWNKDAAVSGLQKFKWVPGGEAEKQNDFGDSGLSDTFSVDGTAQNPGVVSDGEYLYTIWRNRDQTYAGNTFFIYDFDGTMVDDVDLSPWWSKPDELAVGGQMNGGPNDLTIMNGKIHLNCHCSCLMQMVDPARYLQSEIAEDFFVWTNGNGDYVGDHNFEETAKLLWVCMDFNVGPYVYTINADDNLFMMLNAYDVGAVTFGLCGPDGTSLGYFAFAGETAGWKRGELFLDGDTAYDGIYCDNMQSGGTHYDWDATKADGKCYFVGHDSISGVITNAVSVEQSEPSSFAVKQNSPNPFNPTTMIEYSTVSSGYVSINVFNIAGQKVATLVDGDMTSGNHSVVWDASAFSAGTYFYTVKVGGQSKTMKMTLVK